MLIALLTREDVGWSGKYYDFEPLTIMPRPLTRPRPRMMIASVSPEGISAMTRRGFDIQTTPLAGDDELFMRQVGTHKEAKAEMGAAGEGLRIMMSRIIYCARDAADARDKLERAHEYYKRFHNVRERNPAVVTRGCIEPLPYRQTLDDRRGSPRASRRRRRNPGIGRGSLSELAAGIRPARFGSSRPRRHFREACPRASAERESIGGAGESSNTVISFDEPSRMVGPHVPVPGET